MKHVASVIVALALLSAALGCNRGPPTLVPTLVMPPTQTPLPTETLIPTATGIPTQTLIPSETPVPIAIVRRQATLRTGPGVAYAVAGMASFGEHLVIHGRYNGWLLVNEDGGQWIIEGKVDVFVDLESIPLVEEVPPLP